MTPVEIPPVAVYAGDTCVFPTYTFQSGGAPANLVSDGWSDWSASWRQSNAFTSPSMVLSVDSSQAAAGILVISASAAQTRAMGDGGVWDVQALRGSEVRTFLRGTTTYMMDVTRSD